MASVVRENRKEIIRAMLSLMFHCLIALQELKYSKGGMFAKQNLTVTLQEKWMTLNSYQEAE